MQSINDLFTTVHNSTTTFVANSIQSEGNKKVYKDESAKIAAMMFQFPDVNQFKEELEKQFQFVMYQEKFPFSFTTNYRRYKLLAYHNALDILNSLIRRFVTGGESHYVLNRQGWSDQQKQAVKEYFLAPMVM